MQVRVTGEERHSVENLGENAAYRPDIDGTRVAGVSHKKLWRAVPTCGDVVRVLKCCLLPQRAGKSEVTNFDDTMSAEQQILWFDVSVHDLFLMQEAVGKQDLVGDFLHLLKW